MIDNEIISSHLSLNENIVFAYLFGSYAKNNYTNKSDVDIALYLKDISLDSQLQIIYELSKLLKRDVDLVVLNSVKNIYLLEEILKNGVIIKDNSKRVDFELRKEHEILDYKAFKRYIDAA